MKKYLFVSLLSLAFPWMSASCSSSSDDGGAEEPSVVITLKALDPQQQVRQLTVQIGSVLNEPAWIPSDKKGWTFAGWFSDEACQEPYNFGQPVDQPFTLYAGYSRDLVLTDQGKISRVTGATLNGEELPNPNRTDEKWNLGGTDLGIIWEITDGKFGLFFGDSFGADFRPCGGGPGPASDWRSNVLAFSENTDLENGLKFSGMLTDGHNEKRAVAIIERPNYYSFTPIPTAAIALNGMQYMHYMYWEVGSTVHADENYSSIYRSTDNGLHWESCRGQISFSSTSYFGMGAYAKRPGDPYCYMVGTQTGRGYRNSVAKVARFAYDDILDKNAYEFWNGNKRAWIKGRESEATTIMHGTIGELSVMWLERYNRWIALYFSAEKYAICYRSAARIIGPWSEERVLCSGWDERYAQLYGSYIHPLSTRPDAEEIYYTLSQWQPYNVFLMKATVSLAPEF